MSILEDKVSLSSIEPKSIITSNNIGEEIIKSSETGLVNSIIDSNLALVPKLIINDYTKGEKVLTEIINGRQDHRKSRFLHRGTGNKLL